MSNCPLCQHETSTSICGNCAMQINEIEPAKLPDPDKPMSAEEIQALRTLLSAPAERDVYMILVADSGCVFVKELEFFRSQGGFKQRWGNNWVPVVATGIEDAREKGCAMFPAKARPYERQAKA
jgi:hypothetical protein